MRIIVRGETEIAVTPAPHLEIEEVGGAHFGPLQMLAASLGACVLSVLLTWAGTADLRSDGLAVTVSWEYAEDPYRVERFALGVEWPGLPEGRLAGAHRVAETCTVHHTLEHPPEIELDVGTGPVGGDA